MSIIDMFSDDLCRIYFSSTGNHPFLLEQVLAVADGPARRSILAKNYINCFITLRQKYTREIFVLSGKPCTRNQFDPSKRLVTTYTRTIMRNTRVKLDSESHGRLTLKLQYFESL